MTKRFEWDRAKAAANYRKHGVRFEDAIAAFVDPFAIIAFDHANSQSEIREILIGRAARNVLLIIFTERGEAAVRIISARKTTREERRLYEQSKAIPI